MDGNDDKPADRLTVHDALSTLSTLQTLLTLERLARPRPRPQPRPVSAAELKHRRAMGVSGYQPGMLGKHVQVTCAETASEYKRLANPARTPQFGTLKSTNAKGIVLLPTGAQWPIIIPWKDIELVTEVP